jgi:hypothetical protein
MGPQTSLSQVTAGLYVPERAPTSSLLAQRVNRYGNDKLST